ncbi:MAG: hypothetical protein AAFV77_12640 [Planctomycetota bacterium]
MPNEQRSTPPPEPSEQQVAFACLEDLGDALQRVSSAAWQQIAPGSAAPAEDVSLRDVVQSYLHGRIDETEFRSRVMRTQRLATALISSLSQAGFAAYQQVGRFDPDEVESHAAIGKKWHEGVPSASWRTYRDNIGSLDQASVEARVLADLAEYVRQLIDEPARQEQVGADG